MCWKCGKDLVSQSVDLRPRITDLGACAECGQDLRDPAWITYLETALLAEKERARDNERKGIELCQVFGELLMAETLEPRASVTEKLEEIGNYPLTTYNAPATL